MHSPPTLLLVDQNQPLLDILMMVFEDQGYRTQHATNLVTALQCLDVQGFHLVMTDILDPYPVTTLPQTQALRHYAAPIPTGLLTGWHLPAAALIRADFAFLVTKPCELAELLTTVAAALPRALTAQDQQRTDLVHRYFVALAAQDWATLMTMCHVDLHFVLTSGQVLRGRDLYIAYAQEQFRDQYQSAQFTAIVVLATAQGMMARFTAHWQTSTGHTEQMRGASVFRFVGEQMSHIGVTFPTLGVARERIHVLATQCHPLVP